MIALAQMLPLSFRYPFGAFIISELPLGSKQLEVTSVLKNVKLYR